jgi:hypothetical protein
LESFAALDYSRAVNQQIKQTSKIKRQLKLNMKTIVICASIVSMLTAVANAQNANITWGAPTTISGTSDVSTLGTVVGTWAPGDDAYNPDSLPVNGVTFNAYGSGPFNSLVSSSGIDNHYTGYHSPGTADSNYNTILQAAIYNNGETMSITWGGMTAGDTYLLEFWVNDSRNGGTVDRNETLTGGSSTSDPLAYGFAGGGVGQFILGTFVSDGTGTETLNINPGGGGPNGASAQINLLQLRDITSVPEPSTLAFLALGTGAMLFGFHRKNRAV